MREQYPPGGLIDGSNIMMTERRLRVKIHYILKREAGGIRFMIFGVPPSKNDPNRIVRRWEIKVHVELTDDKATVTVKDSDEGILSIARARYVYSKAIDDNGYEIPTDHKLMWKMVLEMLKNQFGVEIIR